MLAHDVHPADKVLTRHTIQHHRLFATERHDPTINVHVDRVCHVLISDLLGGAIIGIAYLKPEAPFRISAWKIGGGDFHCVVEGILCVSLEDRKSRDPADRLRTISLCRSHLFGLAYFRALAELE